MSKKVETPEHRISPFFGLDDADTVFETLRRDFDRLLSTYMRAPTPLLMPSCDVVDEGNRYTINVDIPGVRKEEIKLNVSDNTVEISAQHKEAQDERKKNYIRKERRLVSYDRIIPLPDKVDSSKTKAKLTNGILSIEILKVSPTPKPRTSNIQIQ